MRVAARISPQDSVFGPVRALESPLRGWLAWRAPHGRQILLNADFIAAKGHFGITMSNQRLRHHEMPLDGERLGRAAASSIRDADT